MLKLVFLLLSLICLGQIAQASQQQDKPFNFVLSMEKLNYYVAEPITITGLLSNKQNDMVKILSVSQTIYYRKRGYDFIPYTSRRNLSGGFMGVLPMEFKPNENISEQETLLYNVDTNQYVLDTPGIYEFKSSFSITFLDGRSQEYMSDINQVTVFEPLDKDKNALKALKGYQIGWFLNGLSSNIVYKGLEGTIEKAALFVEEYENSFYTPLVSRQLKASLNRIKQENDGELPPEIETIYNRVKNLIEIETIEDQQ